MKWQRPRFHSFIAGLLFLGAGIGSGTSVQGSQVIPFDPNGTGGATSLQLGSIDSTPGNALAVGAIANGSIVTGTPFQLLYQAKIGNLLDGAGNIVATPGLTTGGELTIVAQFNEVATLNGTGASLSTNTSQAGSFVRIYFDPGNNANDLAGTGFNDGTLIYEGAIGTNGSGNFSVFSTTPQALDQFGTNDYPGLSTIVGGGLTSIEASTVFQDADFFLSPLGALRFSFNTSTLAPFLQVNPAAQMFDGTAAATLASLGAINGVTGPNFLFQADANASFVPEPSSMALAGLGFACTLAYRWRRARRQTA
jgi:hypothetical protein